MFVKVRNQDTPFVVGAVADNRKGRDLAWEFYKNNFSMFWDRYKTGGLAARLVKFTSGSFSSEEKALEVEKFFKDNENPAERTVKQSIEAIRLNAAWRARDRENIAKFLSENL